MNCNIRKRLTISNCAHTAYQGEASVASQICERSVITKDSCTFGYFSRLGTENASNVANVRNDWTLSIVVKDPTRTFIAKVCKEQ